MKMIDPRWRRPGAAGSVAVVALLVAACGSSGGMSAGGIKAVLYGPALRR